MDQHEPHQMPSLSAIHAHNHHAELLRKSSHQRAADQLPARPRLIERIVALFARARRTGGQHDAAGAECAADSSAAVSHIRQTDA